MRVKPRAPAFPLYAGDFLSDPHVDAMTPEELGGYFRLLLIAWKSEDHGCLPNDERKLAKWSRLGARWAKCGPAIMACFRVSDDGLHVFQKRMVKVAKDQEAYRLARSQSGKAGNEKRWASSGKPPKEASLGDDFAIANTIAKHRFSSSSSSSSSKTTPTPSGSEVAAAGLFGDLPLLAAPPDPLTARAEMLLAALNDARVSAMPGSHRLKANEVNLKLIRERLAEGHSEEEVRHVIAVCAAEVRANPASEKWFNAETPFRPAQFQRKLSMTLRAAAHVPVPVDRNGAPQRAAGRLPSLEERLREEEAYKEAQRKRRGEA